MTVTQGLDLMITFLKAFIVKFDNLFIVPGVSVLGFSVAITILCVVIGAILLRS